MVFISEPLISPKPFQKLFEPPEKNTLPPNGLFPPDSVVILRTPEFPLLPYKLHDGPRKTSTFWTA
ncbi:MAG: hypothetical protein ABFD61_08915, partial [Chloroherpetonaceae bacterium]